MNVGAAINARRVGGRRLARLGRDRLKVPSRVWPAGVTGTGRIGLPSANRKGVASTGGTGVRKVSPPCHRDPAVGAEGSQKNLEFKS